MENPFQFNTSDKYIGLSTSDIPQSTFTYEFWYKTDQLHELDTENPTKAGADGATGQQFVLFPLYGGENARGTGVSAGRNGVSIYEHTSNYLNARIVFAKPMNGWNHIAVVYENNAPTLYINGVAVASRTATQDYVKPDFTLGYRYGNNSYLSGWIDEFRIWSRALSETEIRSNMNFEYTGLEDGLAVYYNFDNIQKNNQVFDNSGNNRHGELKKEFGFIKYAHSNDTTAVQNSGFDFLKVADIEFPPASDSIKYNIDEIEQGQYSVEITGWAFIRNGGSRDDKTYLVLTSENARTVYTTETVTRIDVAKNLQDTGLTNSGFKCKIPLYPDYPGNYRIGLLIKPADEKAAYHLTNEIITVFSLVPSDNIVYALDNIKEVEGGYILNGFAYVDGFNRKNSTTRICLKSDQYFYFFKTKSTELKLGSSADKAKFKVYGFRTFINKDDLGNEEYEIGIHISNMDALNVSRFTGRIINNTEN